MPDAPMTEADLAEIEARAAMQPGAVLWRVPAFLDQVRLDMRTAAAALRRLQAENADLKAALAGATEMAKRLAAEEPGWSPIEEAPKDGTLVLLGDARGGDCLIAGRDPFAANHEDYPWLAQDGMSLYSASAFTHFRPLPAPPVSPEAREDADARLAAMDAETM